MDKNLFSMDRFQVEKKNRDYFGEELSKWFQRPMYSIYRKHGRERSERIFNEMKKRNDKEFTHFMQLLHHDGKGYEKK